MTMRPGMRCGLGAGSRPPAAGPRVALQGSWDSSGVTAVAEISASRNFD